MVKRAIFLPLFAVFFFGARAQARAYVPDVGEGVCVYNCDVPSYSSSSGSGSSSSYSYNDAAYQAMGQATYAVFNQIGQGMVQAWTQAAAAQARAQAEASRQRRIALDLNNRANALFSEGRWDEAISKYQDALQYAPADKVIQKNLKNAKVRRLIGFGEAAHRQGRWEEAQKYYEDALRVDPASRAARKSLRRARALRSDEIAAAEEARLKAGMAEAHGQIKTRINRLNETLAADRLNAEERAEALTHLQRLQQGKGVIFRDDIPVPVPDTTIAPYEAPHFTGKGEGLLSPVIDTAAEAGRWIGGHYGEVRDLIYGEMQNRLPGGKLKGIRDGIDDLRKKIGGEHEKTTRGLFEHMERGVEEAASPDIRGDTDERIDDFLKERGEGYQGMAEEEMQSRIKGAIRQVPEGTPQTVHEASSTTTPILNKKSYAAERAAQLN